jgi:hypothetical protein
MLIRHTHDVSSSSTFKAGERRDRSTIGRILGVIKGSSPEMRVHKQTNLLASEHRVLGCEIARHDMLRLRHHQPILLRVAPQPVYHPLRRPNHCQMRIRNSPMK